MGLFSDDHAPATLPLGNGYITHRAVTSESFLRLRRKDKHLSLLGIKPRFLGRLTFGVLMTSPVTTPQRRVMWWHELRKMTLLLLVMLSVEYEKVTWCTLQFFFELMAMHVKYGTEITYLRIMIIILSDKYTGWTQKHSLISSSYKIKTYLNIFINMGLQIH